ncbi:MAG: hypothetical protein ACOVT5_11640 [Armatimonadaceae bacterium]
MAAYGGDRPLLGEVMTALDTEALVTGRLWLSAVEGGKPKGGRVSAAGQAAMLRTRTFFHHLHELDWSG